MAYIIAFANHKGGVGKTSSVASVGSVLASAGYRTLLVDLDTQANLTFHFIGLDEENEPKRFIHNALLDKGGLPQVSVREDLYLCPSSLDMLQYEFIFGPTKPGYFLLKKLLSEVSGQYDFVLIDCPPSLGFMTRSALVACDRLCVPTVTTFPSYCGLKMMMAFVRELHSQNPSLAVNDVFFTFYEHQLLQTRRIEEQIREELGDVVMNSTVRRNVRVSEAYVLCDSVVECFPDSAGAKDYIALTKELLTRISNN